MPLYMYQASYTNESWAVQLHKRQNVLERLAGLGKALNVDVKDAWYAFGDHDIVVLTVASDAEAAAAFALAVAAGGSVKSLKTTCLLSVGQGLDAMKRASDAATSYQGRYRLFVSYEDKEDLGYLVKYVGEDNLFAGSDYGHHGGGSFRGDPSAQPQMGGPPAAARSRVRGRG